MIILIFNCVFCHNTAFKTVKVLLDWCHASTNMYTRSDLKIQVRVSTRKLGIPKKFVKNLLLNYN